MWCLEVSHCGAWILGDVMPARLNQRESLSGPRIWNRLGLSAMWGMGLGQFGRCCLPLPAKQGRELAL